MKKNIFKLLVIALFCITLVGCGKGTRSSRAIDLESNSRKEVIKYSDIMTYVYYHDKKNVTGFEIYLKYDNHDAAQIMYDSNKNAGNYNSSMLEKVEVVDNYIIMTYNETGYQGIKTYEELMKFSNKYNK